jgi:hypothetical protein
MARALSKLAEFDHRLKSDKDDPAATVFRLRPLSGLEQIRANDMRISGGKAANAEYILRTCLTGWSRFMGESGEVEFDEGDMTANLQRLSVKQTLELVNAVYEASYLDEAERKN